MECTKCHIRKDISEFSLKNVKENIYYLYCNQCREKTLAYQKKYKERAKEDYELKKKTCVIECECGKSYTYFRDYHITRHIDSKHHQNYVQSKKLPKEL
jgi:hypothetical protein